MRESDIMRHIMVAMSAMGHRAFRNQSGSYELKDGRWISSGLCEGAADLIGWTREGKFLAIEVKSPGARTDARRLKKQEAFIEAVNLAGGVGFFAESVNEAMVKVSARCRMN